MPRLAAAAIVVAAAMMGTGCHDDPGTAPSPPATRAQVVTTVLPVPLVATPEVAGATVRYRITANLTFRETAGFAATVSELRVTIALTSGQAASTTYNVGVPVTASGSATYVLQQSVELPGSPSSGKWRLDATGTGPGTTPLSSAPVETDLSIVSPQAVDAVFAGAGDIARCPATAAEATAKLLDALPGTVFTVGDNVYPLGTAELYQQCYAPTWGRHLWRTYATPGNHDWDSGASAFYLGYFGPAAAPSGLTYLHVPSRLVGHHRDEQQHPDDRGVRAIRVAPRRPGRVRQALRHGDLAPPAVHVVDQRQFDVGARRLAPAVPIRRRRRRQRARPRVPAVRAAGSERRPEFRGIREFVVGTGGDTLYDRKTYPANSEVFENKTFGVLKLTLKSGSYDWEFVPVAGQSFRDVGSGPCVRPSVR